MVLILVKKSGSLIVCPVNLPANKMFGSLKVKSMSANALYVIGVASGPKSFAMSSPEPSPTILPTTVNASD